MFPAERIHDIVAVPCHGLSSEKPLDPRRGRVYTDKIDQQEYPVKQDLIVRLALETGRR
jgi:hypothetical protein